MYALTQQTIDRQQNTIDSLRSRLAVIVANDSVGATMAPELKVVFPKVRDIAVTTAVVCAVDSARLDTLNLALVRYSAPMTAAETRKFRSYLEARLARSPITVLPL
jgi:hypothetical protein